MKKSTWLSFGVYAVANLLCALVVSVITSKIIESRTAAADAPDSTVISMQIAGFIAPLLLAIVSGWQCWRPGPFYAAAACAAALFTGNPGFGVVIGAVAAGVYLLARKGRQVIFYYFPVAESSKNDELKQQ